MTDYWPAPAKLNLFLHVIGRRADGYHELQTLFQLLDWGDTVRIRPVDCPAISRAGANYRVPESEDLALRAARLLQAETGCCWGAEIEVNKQIPMGSGMGGGSSDAATVLVVLNSHWGCRLSREELASIGGRLGADVPLFVHGRSAIGTGRGDELQPVRLGERHYVLVFPDFAVATAELFAAPDLPRNTVPITTEQALAGLGRNDFEPLVRQKHPQFAGLMQELSHWGRPVMTGTGSGIFIAMRDEMTAKRAAAEMKCRYNVRAVNGVDHSPLQQALDVDGE
ncbi:MAG: 4-(cytidine 5'-diphospho)-2-C-methyl-D-erythritol kinase [Xanthomonadales bacterium]|nr:4-(cytidine 5'-diphospho)-2-C-methyl-D-erythritol kinase [Xanthomonadales bacterium]